MFNPATPLSYLDYVLDKVDVILLMSVNPGFGGQSFLPSTLKKLQQARRLIEKVVAYMEDTLKRTPDMLPVLKQAGVVDSGGEGLMTFVRG